ncbi:hypothetical protein SEA_STARPLATINUM_189 [Streptomyces phage StarPlatinum]|uniref:DUF732 domain-containing protein n=1 Tax=Streptomyces phage StarPlatinum TaxID=2283265 RepID=A0A345M8T3_9CAUD|nr:hypothetical protein HWB77_gp133 [Streptomyces phage StarPlatinum]AXH66904.1 hypothetical protein SEA_STARPLATINUM_189 [Streptomyces phage StarPlatinum]
MGRRRVASSLAIMLLSVVACSRGESDFSTKDKAFVKTVRQEITASRDMSDGQLIESAKAVCNIAEEEDNFLDVVDRTRPALGFTPSDTSYYVGASIAAYCPENKNIIPGA